MKVSYLEEDTIVVQFALGIRFKFLLCLGLGQVHLQCKFVSLLFER